MSNKNSSVNEQALGETVSLETKSRIQPAAEHEIDPELQDEFEDAVSKPPLKTTGNLKREADDPFKPENLRLDQSALQASVAKRLLITVPVHKPNKQDFVRVHPSEEYRAEVALLNFERETYLLVPTVCAELSESEYYTATLYTAINRQKVTFLWPVKLPGMDGRQMDWHVSAAEGAQKAMSSWVRITANMDLGAYDVFEAIADYGEPNWPAQSYWNLIKIAFKNRLIQSVDHQIIQKLRGLA
jgi:hypothetical protein